MSKFDLNDLVKFGKKAIEKGAPVLGSGLLGPAGELVAEMVLDGNGVSTDAPDALQRIQDKLFENGAYALKMYEMDHAEEIAIIATEARVTESIMEATKSHNETEAAQVQSSDNFTRRARPTRTYVYMAILLLNYGIPPMAALFGTIIQPVGLPSWLFGLIGADCGIYSWLRTQEKGLDPIGTIKGAFGR
ncbi:MAG: hypothetical protein GY841_00695 [FCB group bacterium]|nr:hypothetical protein [FCB group bacterium]